MQKTLLAMTSIMAMLIMTSCAYTPSVNPPIPALMTKQGTGGALAGTTLGITANAANIASFPAAVVVGTAVGGYIGAHYMKTTELVQGLYNRKVQVVQIGNSLRIIIRSDKLFEGPISSKLRPTEQPTLDLIIKFMQRYGEVAMAITAYTDNVLSPEDSYRITSHQAKTVAGYFWSHGIAYTRVYPYGANGENPIATNGNSVGSAYNRRVEITLYVVDHHIKNDKHGVIDHRILPDHHHSHQPLPDKRIHDQPHIQLPYPDKRIHG